MPVKFADRMSTVHRSFIREILKVTEDASIISFAGGLPNPELFPVADLEAAAVKVMRESGPQSMQYSTTEGFQPLRQYIADRYMEKKGIKVDADEILITSGSQQCLDLLGKVFLNAGDNVVIERPGYLGAIQSFSVFESNFLTVGLEEDGPDLAELERVLDENEAKMFYAVTNFQNPSGLTYSAAKRQGVADILKGRDVLFVEDDPYGELRFMGDFEKPVVRGYLEENGILLGSFSKVAAPGFRLGWMVCGGEMRDKLIIAKQASDLHTSTFAQRVMHQYVTDNPLDNHIEKIRERYGNQRAAMVQAIEEYFPAEAKVTRPEGGMFLWVTLPEGMSSMDLFDEAIKNKVAFVPGRPFYVDGSGENTFRLNFSNSDEEHIVEGIKRLGAGIKDFLSKA
ncbi:PLP-dependent aminotransferase family protein [Maridesulfovibrio salexigens]|uniref:Putative transcriptional regulator, GntR family n=1 Tax=Maridesulfovibrio salexigens (strain ATCC 14822 / DSM 2638 / NCIMB 8403 / VKM B-1763) TaxID=526222 RepID=C6BS59_MARSD|nr:PLP-dependent aminotransferase family protein [Maridesulfovibrio salexigens]ACS79535.1 putative transcriptional regulator, GntR family [Maridesulfovibrio salexigens DSM 2638]